MWFPGCVCTRVRVHVCVLADNKHSCCSVGHSLENTFKAIFLWKPSIASEVGQPISQRRRLRSREVRAKQLVRSRADKPPGPSLLPEGGPSGPSAESRAHRAAPARRKMAADTTVNQRVCSHQGLGLGSRAGAAAASAGTWSHSRRSCRHSPGPCPGPRTFGADARGLVGRQRHGFPWLLPSATALSPTLPGAHPPGWVGGGPERCPQASRSQHQRKGLHAAVRTPLSACQLVASGLSVLPAEGNG